MSYKLKVISDNPIAYWRLSAVSGTTETDLSGNNYTMTYTNTPTLNLPPITYGGKTVNFSGTQYSVASVPNLLFPQRENNGITIEAWVVSVGAPTTKRLIAGRDGLGLYISQAGFEMIVTNSVGVVTSSIYPVTDWTSPKYVVGIYGNGKVSTYVNLKGGTPADFNGTFATTSTNFFIGGTGVTNANSVSISDVAVYLQSISTTTMKDHYTMGLSVQSPSSLSVALGATYYGMDDSHTVKYLDFIENKNSDFYNGTLTNIVLKDNAMYPTNANQAATRISVPIELDGFAGLSGGSRIDWSSSGQGVTVETSVDGGATWQVASNHSTISGLSAGTNLNNKTLQTRVTLSTTDLIKLPAILDRIHCVVFSSKNILSDNGQGNIAITDTAILDESQKNSVSYSSISGTKFIRPGAGTIPSQLEPTVGLSMWYRRDSNYSNGGVLNEYIVDFSPSPASYIYISTTNTIVSSGFTVYVNGVSKAPAITDFPLGVWVHLFLVPTAPSTAAIYLNRPQANTTEVGNNSFNAVSIFTQSLPTDTISRIYGYLTGASSIIQVDPKVNSLSEISYTNYNLAWSNVQSSG